ncbi:ARMT1-like domain-containing protein [Methanimicrococcus sp. OttesenSCG-928-J09]|nr:ARMT1-like domain-containing protein [Methanimicrococcus sp. OttesenSCG-928-J09]
MKINPRCTYCLLSRIHYQSNLVTDDAVLINKVMKECISALNDEYDPSKTSTHIGTAVHRRCFEVLGNHDPYKEVKKINTQTALEMLPEVQKMIYGIDGTGKACTFENSPFPIEEIFEKVILAAVIGNYFDFGVMGIDASDEEFKLKFHSYFEKGLDINDTKKMMTMLSKVVYMTDNCGEIVYDREVLKVIKKIQQMQHAQEKAVNPNAIPPELILIVRGAPILTDAVLEDAENLQMEAIADKILTTGTNAVGIKFEEAPEETITAMKEASLIIAKGMANFESLSDEKEMYPIAFLLRTKCESVAEAIGVEMGVSIAKLKTE